MTTMSQPDVELGKPASNAHRASPELGSLNTRSFMANMPTLSKAFLTTGLPVVFKDITYTVVNSQNKKEKIDLLTNVSGILRPGELTSLMGPSGSGKSTLLDILAGRKTVGTIKGDIKFGGQTPNKVLLRRFTGYVEQFDTLLDMLTVEEMMMYTAELKRPISQSKQEKKAAVDELIKVLALDTCRNVRIGSPMARGISGGQSKRVNIGIALITNPKVLFLDEPTSGLDSYTANEVMTAVKSLANMGITVCATIHSPTPYTFGLFDRLLLLLRGNMAYLGTNGKPAVDYFHNSCPNVSAIEEGENSAEWIVDLTTNADRQGMSKDFAETFKNSPVYVESMKEVDEELARGVDKSVASTLNEEDKRANKVTVTPTWWALKTWFMFRTLRLYRMPEFLGPRIADKILNSFIIFSLFWSVGDNFSPDNLINISAVLFLWVANPAFAAVAYTPSIVLERPVFIREQNDGLYRVITYLVAKTIEELMLAFVASLVFSVWVFFAVQFQGSFFLFWLVLFTTLSTGIILGYFIAAISPNMDVANAALPAYVVTLLFFAGFMLRWPMIPDYWQWYGYLDFIRYAWGALMKNQFQDNDPVFLTQPDGTNITILQYYELDGINKWGWFGIQWCFFAFFFTMAYLALRFVRHDKR